MKSNVKNSHKKTSDFFCEDQEVEKGLQSALINISELELQCCGHGFFQQIKKNMITNFIHYLKQLVSHNQKSLKVLKVIFNGFDVNGNTLQEIIKSIKMVFTKQMGGRQSHPLKVIHFHTSNLKNCSLQAFDLALGLVSKFNDANCEEISLQFSDWDFKEGNQPNANEMAQVLQSNFSEESLNYKKFRLEISTWYNNEIRAFKFLQNMLPSEQIARKLLEVKSSQEKDQGFKNNASRLTSQELVVGRDSLMAQSNQVKNKFNQERVKDKLVGEKKKLKKKKMELELQMKMAKDKATAAGIQKEVQKIQNQIKVIEVNIEDQEKSIKNIEKSIINRDSQLSKIINHNSLQSISRVKVEQFHKQMKDLIDLILNSLAQTGEDIQFDFRNWHSSFNMGRLKNALDTKVGPSVEFSLINKGMSKLVKGFDNKGQNKKGVKTVYMM